MPAISVDNPLELAKAIKPETTDRPRRVKSITSAPRGLEGEGFPVRRAFAGIDMADLDPFVHMDQMGEVDYGPGEPKGTPWHPHRGFETVTYMIDGTFLHQDSIGGGGVIQNGATQWMTAGAGILHIERPPDALIDSGGLFHGIQLWVNLPAKLKMTNPRYQDIEGREIPEVIDDDGVKVKIICGDFWGKKGPVEGVAADPRYLDVFVPAGKRKTLKVETYRQAFAYIFEGSGSFSGASEPFGVLREELVDGEEIHVREVVGNRSLVVLDTGDEVTVRAGDHGVRFLLVSGKPIREPVAWHGPIVMNTQAEIRQALSDLRSGAFIR
jgi:quercetin 2,3-dioxygenase